MNRTQRIEDLTELFVQTGKDHHQAFLATDGSDPDWALWYARHAKARLSELLEVDLVEQDLVCALVQAADEHGARAADRPWAPFYAELFTDRYHASTEETLALYYFEACPFCRRVLTALKRLNVEVELRDIWRDPQHRTDLINARGRATVPVLRCMSGDVDRWMPESRDIIAYLERRFG